MEKPEESTPPSAPAQHKPPRFTALTVTITIRAGTEDAAPSPPPSADEHRRTVLTVTELKSFAANENTPRGCQVESKIDPQYMDPIVEVLRLMGLVDPSGS